ncbi:ParB/RepB/Spo0J family partition protein [Kineococcus rhizosphaerae]|uniref:Chromosome segregation DNA-binding protein n=1 Tax=Kineococcus rhizosphaerae TaxID=559628 RepID=A0A2T0QYI6_9ACTN|nr:ParB/RepB/Spo0J family partition protein [Kineococcus rhizosphaerae]PRY11442.1 chromosome segregation DNA-binding protein [Kineococcus rhizosphaerae]
MSDKRRGLGRGLGALIPSGGATTTANRPGSATTSVPPAMRPASRPVDLFFDQRPLPVEEEDVHDGHPADLSVVTTDETPQEAPEGVSETPRDPENAGGPAAPSETPQGSTVDDLVDVPGARFAEIPVTSITPNPRQPRTVFDEDDLAELVHSIREIGVLQPIVVRPIAAAEDGGARYELVMGERRWRASTEAGLDTIPAIVRDTADDDLLRDALLENLHRSQLNPLEEAAAYQQLLEDFGCTHEELASRIGRSRPQISNTLRLMKLPPLVQRRVAAGVISAGHARALLSLEDGAAMERLAQRVVAEGLSVRAVEEMIALGDADHTPRRRAAAEPQPGLDARATMLADRLDTRVKISMGRTRGRLTVDFAGEEDLDRILALLGATNQPG